MVLRFMRSLAVLMLLAAGLLALFAGSDHQIPVLPRDASPLGVFLGAAVCAIGVAAVEEILRHKLRLDQQ